MGASGGGPHALACAALLSERVLGAVCLAGLAPFAARADLDWYAGMVSDGALRAAAAGRPSTPAPVYAGPPRGPALPRGAADA
jgi:hypothetical protein